MTDEERLKYPNLTKPNPWEDLYGEVERLRAEVVGLRAEAAGVEDLRAELGAAHVELDRLRSLRKKVEHLAYCHRSSWPRESYKVPHVGPYVSTAGYNEALRAVLDEVKR